MLRKKTPTTSILVSVDQQMNPDARGITERNDRRPFHMAKECVNATGLAH